MTLSGKRIRLLVGYFQCQPVLAVYLFGSYARGDADRESDIDLFVKVDFAANRPINIGVCKRDLKALLGVRADVYEHHKLPKYVKRSVMAESILLYVRS